MNDRKLAKLRSLGLSESDFKPKEKTDAERIADLEKENKELKEKSEFLEECLVEIGNIIYS